MLKYTWNIFLVGVRFFKLDGGHGVIHVITGNLTGLYFVDIDHRVTHENHMINTTYLILFAVPGPFLGILEGPEEVALEHHTPQGNVREEHGLLLGHRDPT